MAKSGYNTLLETIAYLLTDYLSGIDYKPERDKDMDKIIELLGIEFGHDDVGELYWFYNGC